MFRRILAASLLVVAGAGALIAAWPQLFGLHRMLGVAQLVSLRGLAVVVAACAVVVLLLVALVSARARRFTAGLALVFVAFILINAAVLGSRGFGDASFQVKGEHDLRVLTWNTLGDLPPYETVAGLAAELEADIVVLPETTAEYAIQVAGAMAARGFPVQPHTIAYDQVSKARSTSLLVALRLGEYLIDRDVRVTGTLPSIVGVPGDGRGPTIVAVHAVAPLPSLMDAWRADLDALAALCDAPNVIMAGDFNATLDHFSGLETASGAHLGQCVDAAAATGNGAAGTWPTLLPAPLGAPIDHILATPGWEVTGARVILTHDHEGSDHRPVLAQLRPTS